MTAYTETVDGQTTSASRAFDAANRLQTSLDATAGTTSYIYDDNGNLTTVYPPGSDGQNPVGVLRYDYDQRNLMVSHETNPDGTAWVLQVAYVYDGANDRLQQVNYTSGTPVTTTYSNDVVGLTQVLVANDGTNQVYNLFGLDLILQDSGSEVRTLLADGLGSVRVEMEGNLVETATTYSPYGEVLEQRGTSGTVYGFTGEQEDSATGLLYLRARYYAPYIYRMLSPDPIIPEPTDPQSFNRYSYVRNNPLNFTDPSGYCRYNADGEFEYATDCTLEEFSTLSWNDRIRWLEMFMAETEVPWFNNIFGIIEYFSNDPHFATSSWALRSDGAVLQVIQDGWRIATGVESIEPANNASAQWAVFFRLEATTGGQRSLEGLTLEQWGDAEQAGVDFALAYARPYFNRAGESEQEKIEHFVWWGDQYRRFISAGINQLEVARWATDPRESTSSPFVRMFSSCAISAPYDLIGSRLPNWALRSYWQPVYPQ